MSPRIARNRKTFAVNFCETPFFVYFCNTKSRDTKDIYEIAFNYGTNKGNFIRRSLGRGIPKVKGILFFTKSREKMETSNLVVNCANSEQPQTYTINGVQLNADVLDNLRTLQQEKEKYLKVMNDFVGELLFYKSIDIDGIVRDGISLNNRFTSILLSL